MQLEELADLSADKLEAMSDAELTEVLSPFFDTTRPEIVQKQKQQLKEQSTTAPAGPMNQQKKMLKEMLEEGGVDMSFLNRRKRK